AELLLLTLPAVRRMSPVPEELSLVPLHQHPELLEACAELLAEEWGKSRALRLHALQRSSDAFPTCLALLRAPAPAKPPCPCCLVGHVRLSRVAGQPSGLFVESVVVARALRGRGYGRQLMEATERYARTRGFRCLHLSTHDKQQFYAHLGFVPSEPVQIVPFLSPAMPAAALRAFAVPPSPTAAAPAVPAAPRLPLPPPGSGQSPQESPHRDTRGLPIFWMKKDI
uniref:N(alpha)-acetyltransferase 80, NatH catalytic subunit n=1 Tax=Pavo cristatus TaxID=9049 RepID=A0A8C9FIZ3_PAVCR